MATAYHFFDRSGNPCRLTRDVRGLAVWSLDLALGGEVHLATWEYAQINHSGKLLSEWLIDLGCTRNFGVTIELPDGWVWARYPQPHLVDIWRS